VQKTTRVSRCSGVGSHWWRITLRSNVSSNTSADVGRRAYGRRERPARHSMIDHLARRVGSRLVRGIIVQPRNRAFVEADSRLEVGAPVGPNLGRVLAGASGPHLLRRAVGLMTIARGIPCTTCFRFMWSVQSALSSSLGCVRPLSTMIDDMGPPVCVSGQGCCW
jgi:hypothetical protein